MVSVDHLSIVRIPQRGLTPPVPVTGCYDRRAVAVFLAIIFLTHGRGGAFLLWALPAIVRTPVVRLQHFFGLQAYVGADNILFVGPSILFVLSGQMLGDSLIA